MSRWYPVGAQAVWDAQLSGRLLAYEYGVYRVVSVDPVHTANWSDDDRAVWLKEGMPDPWRRAPYRLLVEYVAGKRAKELRHERMAWHVPAGSHAVWHCYPETGRWPMCSCCGEPMPCQAEMQDRAAAVAMETLDRNAAKMPGHCWACGDPVSHRQEAVSFAGINLDLPGGPVVVFHTRRKCFSSATRYELRWLDAEPGRQRILTWPSCPGSLLVHKDGVSECHGGLDDCRGHSTHDHRSLNACYVQSHGCPKCENTSGHHPGCRPRDRVPRHKTRMTP